MDCGCGQVTNGTCMSIDQVIEFTESIQYCKVRVEVSGKDITPYCRFSWSLDKVTWSCWATYAEFDRQSRGIDGDFYLRIIYRSLQKPIIYINNIAVHCYNTSIYQDNPFLSDPCSTIEQSGFDLYAGWDCALMMQQQLSDTVICMVGIPVFYFKVDPDVDTKSYTFKEYTLHAVQSVKQIKMIVTDGNMPSSKPTISEWDMDFETDWDTELSKTQFATAFGVTAFPKQRDFIWVPMQKRMYMVNTAYEEKNENLMWHAVAWKLSLVKWQDQDNIDQGDLEAVIDSLIVNTHDSAFSLGETREGEMVSERVLASPYYAATNLYSVESKDYIRKSMTMNRLKISDRQINHGSLIVTKNKYIPQDNSEVHYQKSWCGQNGTMSLVFDVPLITEDVSRPIVSISDWDLAYKDGGIEWNGRVLPLDKGGTYLVVVRWSRDLRLSDIKIVKHVAPDGMPSYKITPMMYRFDFAGATNNVSAPVEYLSTSSPMEVVLRGYPLQVSSFKLYNTYIDDDHLDEVLKYTSSNENLIINDLARPLLGEHGYSVV